MVFDQHNPDPTHLCQERVRSLQILKQTSDSFVFLVNLDDCLVNFQKHCAEDSRRDRDPHESIEKLFENQSTQGVGSTRLGFHWCASIQCTNIFSVACPSVGSIW